MSGRGFFYGDDPTLLELANFVDGLPSWQQPDWYVSWATGDDSRDGTTPARAVKTVMGGIAARWGVSNPVLRQDTRIHILDSQPLGAEQITLAPIMGGPYTLSLIGTPSPVGSPFAAGAVTAKNRAAQQMLRVDLSARGGPTPRGTLVVNTTRASSYAWSRDTAAGSTAMSQPIAAPSGVLVPDFVEDNGWSAGDVLQAYDLPTINLAHLMVSAGRSSGPIPDPGTGLRIRGLRLLDSSGAPGNSILVVSAVGGYSLIEQSYIEPYLFGILPSFSTLVGSYVAGGWVLSQAKIGAVVLAAGSPFGGTLRGDVTLDADAAIEGICQINAPAVTLGDVEIEGTLQAQSVGVYLAPSSQPEAVLWGAGQIDVAGGGGVRKTSAASWAASLALGAITIDGQTTGTSYTPSGVGPGIWTDGIALTPANLDAYGGLQNPRTGSRYA